MAAKQYLKEPVKRTSPAAPLAVVLLLLLGLCACSSSQLGQDTLEVTLGGERFTLELALDPASRFQGLSDRPSIDDRGGMIFVFPQAGVRRFVMRRCLVPIDIIFLSPTGRVVQTHAMQVEPIDWEQDTWSERDLTHYSSVWPAQFAIEIQGGLVASLGIEVGQQVSLPFEALVARAQ